MLFSLLFALFLWLLINKLHVQQWNTFCVSTDFFFLFFGILMIKLNVFCSINSSIFFFFDKICFPKQQQRKSINWMFKTNKIILYFDFVYLLSNQLICTFIRFCSNQTFCWWRMLKRNIRKLITFFYFSVHKNPLTKYFW